MMISTGMSISIGVLFIVFGFGLLIGGYVVWVVITHKVNPFK